MLRNLLVARSTPVYLLEPDPHGAKFAPAAPGEPTRSNGYTDHLVATATTMSALVDSLNFVARFAALDRPILDRTNLTGKYDINLEFSKNNGQDGRPSLFTALRTQLGLRFVPARAPVHVLVLDRAQPPPVLHSPL